MKYHRLMPQIPIIHTLDWLLASFFSLTQEMTHFHWRQTIHRFMHSCFMHFSYLSRHVNINSVFNQAWETIFAAKRLCSHCVHVLCVCVCVCDTGLLVHRPSELRPARLAVSDFSVVVVGLLWGLAGYWQHPSMGQRWQFPSCSLPLHPLASPRT